MEREDDVVMNYLAIIRDYSKKMFGRVGSFLKNSWSEIQEFLERNEQVIKSVFTPLIVVLLGLWLYLRPSGFAEKKVFADLAVKTAGGTAAAMAAYFTWKRLDVSQRTLEVSQEGQITERFTRAIEQIGAKDSEGKNVEIRIGGIYALGNIAQESQKEHLPVLKVLLAYLRKYGFEEADELNEDPHDVKAIVDVLCVYEYESLKGKEEVRDIKLKKPFFVNARFHKLWFVKCNFFNPLFVGVKFEDVSFSGGSCAFGDFSLATFCKVSFTRVDLHGAVFTSATFDEVSFDNVILTDAELSASVGLKKEHIEGAIIDAATRLPRIFLEDGEWYRRQLLRSKAYLKLCQNDE